MAYSELIKNFENIRDYMREFYVYGFKSRNDYTEKSSRSYDDERRRMESWLGEHMSFVRTPEGKNVFISIDSRVTGHNPLYKALKAKSFTDKDITLHFILFDLLHSPEISLSLSEIVKNIDRRLSEFDEPMIFDESTVRKKLKEYTEQGLIVTEKDGRKILYRRSPSVMPMGISDALHFFSEAAPVGTVGSFLLDKQGEHRDNFGFKHHYITSALDSDVTAKLFMAMHKKAIVSVSNHSRFAPTPTIKRIIPLRIFMSVQNGRHHLLAYEAEYNSIKAFRIDYLSDIKIEETTPRFDELRAALDTIQTKMWGVTVRKGLSVDQNTERVEFTVRVEDDEEHIIRRLLREKRIGRIERLDKNNYRFTADVYDISEMIPWIRTFICRITSLDFSNKVLEKQFRSDIKEMYRIYGIEEAEI
ncbi:MAG: WYL domain-containing transcriptional regulator [Clostridia bacterium]|nr:WYL domain-containing transcriptional regulator [Clostridia bacterium]